jgi:hypothetical protein
MHRLPFNPEPLLTLFMTKENAGSLAGDLEEEFQKRCQCKGRVSAVICFWWALLISMPPLLLARLTGAETTPLTATGPSSNEALAVVNLQYPTYGEFVGDECLKGDECQGSIRWSFSMEDGSHSGSCQECGTHHVKCGNCGKINFADDYAHCGNCLHHIPLYC